MNARDRLDYFSIRNKRSSSVMKVHLGNSKLHRPSFVFDDILEAVNSNIESDQDIDKHFGIEL